MEVLRWGHSSQLACHPGLARILHLLREHFLWPSMTQDAKAFIAACEVCARWKTSHQPPTGLHNPLPIPHSPWPHITLDGVAGYPSSCNSWFCLCPSAGSVPVFTPAGRAATKSPWLQPLGRLQLPRKGLKLPLTLLQPKAPPWIRGVKWFPGPTPLLPPWMVDKGQL